MGKNCIFEDNIGVQVLKMFVLKKMAHICLRIFQIQLLGRGDMGQKLHFSI